jgi:hypothetical protein
MRSLLFILVFVGILFGFGQRYSANRTAERDARLQAVRDSARREQVADSLRYVRERDSIRAGYEAGRAAAKAGRDSVTDRLKCLREKAALRRRGVERLVSEC